MKFREGYTRYKRKFAIFILTHGRPHNQLTLETLRRLGYTGKIYLVVDDQDETFSEYMETYKDVAWFNKDVFIGRTETGLSSPEPNFAVFARNAIENIALCNGYDAFMMLDDDITNIRVRVPDNGVLKSYSPKGCLDEIIDLCVEYVITKKVACMGLGFCNLYIGGVDNFEKENPRQRLCAEAFIRNTDYEVKWRLNMVEDLITSVDGAIKNQVWFQFLPLQVDIRMSEGVVDGGNSDVYRKLGKFKVNFMPIIAYPSSNIMRYGKDWAVTTTPESCVPKIISSSYRKEV